MTDASSQFADDAPKTNPWRDDALGFANFSRRLAEALVAQEAPSGYVLGLHGEWGSGKSTVLNFVKSHLAKWREESRADMANLQWFDFDPWIVSGHQDLAAAFFKVLSEKLGDAQERRSKMRRIARFWIDAGADRLIDAAAKVGSAIDYSGGAASTIGATVAKSAAKQASKTWLAEPSLQKTYRQLVDRLRSSDRRFVVFVDDIDRLTSTEIRALMQMVKTVGRLPNVTYCLSYDRKIVWSALSDLAPGEGNRSGYAEKVVQHEVEVPVPTRTSLLRMLEKMVPAMPPAPTSGIRWNEMLQTGMQRWIRHPRDVLRLSNAMQFAWAALRDEVDAHDVLCMEAMRLFDRKVFDWVRENRDLLLGEGLQYPQPNQADAEAAAADLGKSLGEGARADIVPVLRILFPQHSNMFGNRGFSDESWDEVVARRGIATRAGFTAYFGLSPSRFHIPKRMVEEAASLGTSRERQIELIDRALELDDEDGLILAGEYFQELIHRDAKIDESVMIGLLQALVDRAIPVLIASDDRAFSYVDRNHRKLIRRIFERLGPDASAALLNEYFESSDDIGAISSVYFNIARDHGVIRFDNRAPADYISEEQIAHLGAMLLAKIRAAAEESLTALPLYYEVARSWSHLGQHDEARAWLAREAVRNSHSLAKLSRGLLGASLDGSSIEYTIYAAPDTDLYDLDKIAEGCERFVDAPDLSSKERARIMALREGLEMLKHQPEKPT